MERKEQPGAELGKLQKSSSERKKPRDCPQKSGCKFSNNLINVKCLQHSDKRFSEVYTYLKANNNARIIVWMLSNTNETFYTVFERTCVGLS